MDRRRMIVGIVAVICNVVLLAFTGVVLVTDGVSREGPYVVFTLLLLLVPILSVVALVRRGGNRPDLGTHDVPSSRSTVTKRVAVSSNLVWLAFSCWAIVDQYPHPADAGVIPFAVLVVVTPIVSLAALLGRGRREGRVQERNTGDREPERDAER
jgi:hypothetical protein